MTDQVLVIGAGLAGAVIAERFAEASGRKVLVLEKEDEIGGHCRDFIDCDGVVIHSHGPHIFHTDDKSVRDYLSRFTEWTPYIHEVLAVVQGKTVPLPFNRNSMEMCFDTRDADAIIRAVRSSMGNRRQAGLMELADHPEPAIKKLRDFVYHWVFYNYTRKQWGGLSPEELPEEVTSRVPIRFNRDNRYFTDSFQGMPAEGYSAMIRNILDHPHIDVQTGVDATEVLRVDESGILFDGIPFEGNLFCTASIDDILGEPFGPLPYRSLRFEFETLAMDRYQEAAVVNHPNEHAYTRVTEFRHFIPGLQTTGRTTIAREYPEDYRKGVNHPYYIVPGTQSRERRRKYMEYVAGISRFHAVGRLGEYRYFDMDQVVARALDLHERLTS